MGWSFSENLRWFETTSYIKRTRNSNWIKEELWLWSSYISLDFQPDCCVELPGWKCLENCTWSRIHHCHRLCCLPSDESTGISKLVRSPSLPNSYNLFFFFLFCEYNNFDCVSAFFFFRITIFIRWGPRQWNLSTSMIAPRVNKHL